MNDDAIRALGIDRCIQDGGRCEECDDLRKCSDGKLLMQRRRLRVQEDIDRLDKALKGDEYCLDLRVRPDPASGWSLIYLKCMIYVFIITGGV